MSAELDTARAAFEEGNLKRAIRMLWRVHTRAQAGDLGEAKGMLELSTAIAERADGRLRRDAEELAQYSRGVLAVAAEDRATDALVWIPSCRLLAESGLGTESKKGSRWDLIFRQDSVILRARSTIELRWEDIRALEIGGAGQIRSGMRWRGFGVGVQGALTGALMATALNSLTSTTTIDTVIRLETLTSEAFFHYDELVPDELRRRLAPAFVRLRETHPPSDSASDSDSAEHWVERLEKLAGLRDRGLLSADEFEQAKARLFKEQSP